MRVPTLRLACTCAHSHLDPALFSCAAESQSLPSWQLWSVQVRSYITHTLELGWPGGQLAMEGGRGGLTHSWMEKRATDINASPESMRTAQILHSERLCGVQEWYCVTRPGRIPYSLSTLLCSVHAWSQVTGVSDAYGFTIKHTFDAL